MTSVQRYNYFERLSSTWISRSCGKKRARETADQEQVGGERVAIEVFQEKKPAMAPRFIRRDRAAYAGLGGLIIRSAS